MRLLLDTHVILWWLTDDPRLKKRARELIAGSPNDAVASIASLWEIAIKYNAGKLSVTSGFVASWLNELGIAILGVELPHLTALESLPRRHRDPFDRLILAQALVEGMNIMTNDEAIRQYGVPCTGTD